MNYRTILLATAAVMFAGAANAKDITSPMYLPGAGQLLSDTSIGYTRTSLKHNLGAGEDFRLSEEVTYGVTDNFSVVAELGNRFDFEGLTNQEYNNDHNFDYTIGAKYNMRSGNLLSQVGVSYFTYDPKSWYGHRGNDARWQKYLNGEVKVGYELQNGWLPYTTFSATGNIDNYDRSVDYSWFGGVHKTGGKYSVDAGIRYDFNLDGSYRVVAIVQMPGGKEAFASSPARFTMGSGSTLKTFNIQSKGRPLQIHVKQLQADGRNCLFGQVAGYNSRTPIGACYLGKFLHFMEPRIYLDSAQNLHVLCQSSPEIFTYSIMNNQGKRVSLQLLQRSGGPVDLMRSGSKIVPVGLRPYVKPTPQQEDVHNASDVPF